MATIKGKWIFNENITYPSTPTPSYDEQKYEFQNVNFTSNGNSYDSINISTSNGSRWNMLYYGGYDLVEMGGWIYGEEFRTVDFGNIDQTVSDTFYSWFTSNTTQIVEHIVQIKNPITIVNVIQQGGSGIDGGYNVTFKINDDVYQIISVKAGEKIYEPPKKPTNITGYIDHWVDSSGTTITFPYIPSNNIELTAVVVDSWIFGVSGLGNSSPALTRTDDAVGKTYSLNKTTGLYTTDFDNVFNFERVTDSDGNVFARIPKMYRKYTGGDTMQIANYKVDDTYLLYPSFIDDNGNEIDYFDYGCYKGSVSSSKLQSKSGVTPQYSTTIANFRTYARANNTTEWTYFQKDFRARGLIQDLFMIVFATRQTETILGTSVWKSYGSLTGDTDAISNSTLENPLMCCGLNQTSYGFKFFGIEDICGNGFEFVDGIYFSSSSIYVGTKPSKYANSTSNKAKLSYTRPTSTGYISILGYDSSYPFFNYPNAASGSSSTYYCDQAYYNSSGVILYDGTYSFGAFSGLWRADGDGGASSANGDIGSRLCRQPL